MPEDDEQPRLDLFVVFLPNTPGVEARRKAIHAELQHALPAGTTFRIWSPAADEPLMAAVRDAGCQVWPSAPRREIRIGKATPIQIGRPASPLPAETIAKLGQRLSAIPGIEAAFVPMMFGLPDQAAPAQVLVLQVGPKSNREAISAAVAQAVAAAGIGQMDGLQMRAGDPILQSAADTGCIVPLVPQPTKEPKWKFW